MKTRLILFALAASLPGCFISCTTTVNPDGSKTTSLDPELKASGKHLLIAVVEAGEVRALEKIRGSKVETMGVPVTAATK